MSEETQINPESLPVKKGGYKMAPGEKFSATFQPSPESKRRGWQKKLQAQLLVQAVLRQTIKGKEADDLKKEMAETFTYLKEKDITVEMMLIYTQCKEALKGNVQAFTAVMDRAFGKPPLKMNFDFSNPPEPSVLELPGGRVIEI